MTNVAAPPRLRLQEEVLLLSLNDESGTTGGNTAYAPAIGGAIVSELLLAGRIRIVKPRRTHLVEVVDSTPVGDALLDECLEKVALSKRPKSVSSWVSSFSSLGRLKHRVAEGLCELGVLRRDQGKVLLIFNRTTYPTVDPDPERQIIARLRETVADGVVPDARSLVLLSLTHGCGMLPHVLGKQLVKEKRDWIKELVEGDVVGEVAKQVLHASQAATMMVVGVSAST